MTALTRFFLGMTLILSLSCNKSSGSAGAEDSFIAAAIRDNPQLVTPVTQPMSEAEDRLVTDSQDPKDFELDTAMPFDMKDIASYQAISDATPAPLQGIWWMDGNPLTDRTVSFANSKFERRGSNYVTYMPVYGANNFTYLAEKGGELLYRGAKDFGMIYEHVFSADYTTGYTLTSLKIGPVRVKLPRAIADFTIEQKEDGHYIRTIKLLGKTALVYDFIRIIDKNKQPVTGTADDRWNRFIADSRKLTIPKKKL